MGREVFNIAHLMGLIVLIDETNMYEASNELNQSIKLVHLMKRKTTDIVERKRQQKWEQIHNIEKA